MSDIIKKPYSISIWEDKVFYLITEGAESERYETDTLPIGKDYTILNQYSKEIKIADIGAHNNNSPIKVFNPIFTQNINGSNILTFQIYHKYYDDEIEDFAFNPFTNLLVNERKVKLFYDNEWYDFVVKNIQEDSKNYTFTYTCKDLYINELSKNGYDITFDVELENNQGTITELGEAILEGSDWKINKEDSDLIKQRSSEALYIYNLEKNISATCMDDFLFEKPGAPQLTVAYKKGQIIEIPSGSNIYIFYSGFLNKEENLQFLYHVEDNFIVDEDGYILNSPNFSFKVLDSFNNEFYDKELNISTNYFGDKLVRKQISKYIPEIDKYCYAYELGGPYYAYITTEYMAVTEIQNLITNNENFINTTGWSFFNDDGFNSGRSIMKTSVVGDDNKTISSLKINFPYSGNGIKNSGIYDNRKATGGFVKGEKYILAVKTHQKTTGQINDGSYIVGRKMNSNNAYDTTFFTFDNFNGVAPSSLTGYRMYEGTCTQSISYNELLDYTIDFVLKGSGEVYLLDIKLFKKLVGTNGLIIVPNLESEINSIVKTKYNFFPASELEKDIYSDKDLTLTISYYEEDMDKIPYTPVYSENFEKIGSISSQKSNRFNLIQTLCENFDAWAKFSIIHNNKGNISSSYKLTQDESVIENKNYFFKIEDGEMVDFNFRTCKEDELYEYLSVSFSGNEKIDDKTDYYEYSQNGYIELAKNDENFLNLNADQPQLEPVWAFKTNKQYYIQKSFKSDKEYYEKDYGKFISFKEYIGQDNYVGFRYGVNLDTIKRTLDSEQIVSKIIVEENISEYADGGFCTIQDSKTNPTGEKFIFNFDYYIRHGLLNKNDIYNDLYNTKNGLGLYPILKKLNKEIAEPTNEMISISSSLNDLYSQKTLQALAKEAADTEYKEALEAIRQATGSSIDYAKELLYDDPSNNSYVQEQISKRDNAKNTYDKYDVELKNTLTLYNKYHTKYTNLEKYLEKISKKKKNLVNEFYKRYSRFIQEGTWTSSDALDPEVYYLDSQQVLYTSAFPKVSYTINVIEISQVEGYESYNFKIGDKSYVEDTEFFGYNQNGRPYQEEVVVSEISFSLDDASRNTIKVQNYKTQFEDLFQRIAAATQSLQYSEGSYKRAAAAINNDGTIKSNLLQNSLENNSLVLQNAKSESVIWDESGITVSSSENGNEIVRIVGGGIILSNDGGQTWTTGITGSGINANMITTGILNTNNIKIFNGDEQAFQWDKDGISAYYPIDSGANGYNTNQYVRFNHLGLFGSSTEYFMVKQTDSFDPEKKYYVYITGQSNHTLVYCPDPLTVDTNYITKTEEDGITTYGFKSMYTYYTEADYTDSDAVEENATFSLGWNGIRIRVNGQKDEVINVNDRFIVYGDGSVKMPQ